MTLAKNNKIPFKWILNIVLPLLIAFIPATGAFTNDIKWFFVVTIFVIVLIATGNIPLLSSCILLPVLYIIVLNQSAATVFSAWSSDPPWLCLGGLILTLALQKTGLLKRIAYHCILICGGKFRGALYGMLLIGIIISAFISDMPAKAILMGALALGISNAMNFKLGSRGSSALGLAALASCLGPSYLYYTGSGGTIVPMGIAEGMGVAIPSWGEYFIHMAPPQLIYTIITVVIIDLFFKPDQDVSAKEFLAGELKAMGKATVAEKKVMVICVILLTSIVTASFHGISFAHLFLLTAVALMWPGINVITADDAKQANYTALFFITACLTIGSVSNVLGVGAFIAETVYPYISGSTTTIFAGLWGMGFVTNFALTPSAAYSVFTEPLVNMANIAGLNPLPVLYSFSQSLDQFLFPYEFVPALLIFGTGLISTKNFIKYNVLRALASFLCMFAIYIPYWTLIGLM